MALNAEFKKFESEKTLLVTNKNEIECKLPIDEEDSPILFTSGVATLNIVEALDGEIKYGGKVIFTIVKDLNGLSKRELGVEFMYKAELKGATVNDSAFGCAKVENVKVSVTNGIPTVSAALIFVGGVTSGEGGEFLKGLSGANCKKGEVIKSNIASKISKPVSVEDEFDLDVSVKDVLWHQEKVIIKSSTCSIGSVITSGEIELSALIVTLGSESPIKVVKNIPYRIETDVKEAMPSLICKTALEIKNSSLKVLVDENKNKSSVAFMAELSHVISVYETENVSYVVDAYLKEKELSFEKYDASLSEVLGENTIEGKVVFKETFKISKNTRLECPLFVKIEQIDFSLDGVEIKFDGVAEVGVLINDGASYKVETALIPFNLSGTAFGDSRDIIDANAYNLQAEVVGEDINVEFDVLVRAFETKFNKCSFISKIEEGEDKIVNESAISVCIPKPENTLWDIAKALGVSEEEILKTNSDLTFPLTGDERIVIYREIK